MIKAGIDVGAKTIKVVLMEDGKIRGKGKVLSGFDQEESAKEALEHALKEAGLSREAIGIIVTTGNGRKAISYAKADVTEARAAALGAVFLYPSARTVIDVGAEEARAIKCDPSGKVLDCAVNEKCAAGSGAFTEAMARALEGPLEELGPLSLQATQSIPMNAQCAVFAESEALGLMRSGWSKNMVLAAYCSAMAHRVSLLLGRIGVEDQFSITGGIAKNPSVVKRLEKELGIQAVKSDYDSQIAGALGAGVFADTLLQKGAQ